MILIENEMEFRYGLFSIPVHGNDGSHFNLMLYDRDINLWYRIEPAGYIYYNGKMNSIVNNNNNMVFQYSILDEEIREIKKNYLSHNDYYFLPGLHNINKGPYCGFYSTMMIKQYIKHNDIFTVIEKISDIDLIKEKLNQYETILNSAKFVDAPKL